MTYKIIAFDETTAQITIKVADFTPMVVDLPIDSEGNLPTGALLDHYLSGFLPTWHLERQAKLAKGIPNANSIAMLVEPEPIIEPTIEQLANNIRLQRDLFLTESDWTQTLDSPLGEIEKRAWLSYRKLLRDIPEQPSFPKNVVWPISPKQEPR